ncbi:MAG: thioredoxin family protein, partial [Bacteroidota bacterium]|nr:thioredoxin family protein [Bacteroidota bacterium]
TMLLLLSFTITSAIAQTKPASADVLIKNAIAEAAKTNKDLFVIFHASWCGWCHKMDNAMNDGEIQSFFDNNYVIVHLTIDESEDKKNLENPGANELLQRYHGENQGIPYWFIVDNHGNFLADSRKADDKKPAELRSVGCPAQKDEVDYFVKVLKKTSSLNDHELMLIQQRFLKNKE